MAQLTPIRIEKQLKEEIKVLIHQGYFSTMTEFVKDSIRKNLENYRKQEALKALASIKGTVVGSYPTKTQRSKIVEEGFLSKRDIFTDLGLK